VDRTGGHELRRSRHREHGDHRRVRRWQSSNGWYLSSRGRSGRPFR
jgi:hypothetical protein